VSGRFHVEWIGFTELQDTLKALPAGIEKDAAQIVQQAASDASRQIAQAYPLGKTGNLRKGISVVGTRGGGAQRAIVRSAAPHAHLFEYGTKQRQTKKGANRGAMPKAPTNEAMIPIIVRVRNRMRQQLTDMVVRLSGLFEVAS
jgi:hypothetical protein